jgi:hypothetical protein
MSNTLQWSDLPDEMVRAILASLSLPEFARIASTCRDFHALYCEMMAAQQEFHCGQARISCIANLIMQFFKWSPGIWRFKFDDWSHFLVCRDGVMRPALPPRGRRDRGHVFVSVFRGILGRFEASHPYGREFIKVQAAKGSLVTVRFGWDLREAIIQVFPTSDRDLEGVALVQALLSQNLARFIQGSGRHVEINIGLRNPARFTLEGLKAQIGPLLPFASYYTGVDRLDGGLVTYWPRIHVGNAAYVAKEEVAGAKGSPVQRVSRCVDRCTLRSLRALASALGGVRGAVARMLGGALGMWFG